MGLVWAMSEIRRKGAGTLISDLPLCAASTTDGRNFLFATAKCFWI